MVQTVNIFEGDGFHDCGATLRRGAGPVRPTDDMPGQSPMTGKSAHKSVPAPKPGRVPPLGPVSGNAPPAGVLPRHRASGDPASNLVPVRDLPDWVPAAVRVYLAHTEGGRSLREIARAEGVHASTVLRQVRRFESRRDDPLIDVALGRLTQGTDLPDPVPQAQCGQIDAVLIEDQQGSQSDAPPPGTRQEPPMLSPQTVPADDRLLAEAARLLPLLAQSDALIAVAADMDKAVLLREGGAGTQRLAVMDRPVAEVFALRGWIQCHKPGRVAQYVLAPEGRAMLRKLGAVAAQGRAARPADVDDDDPDGRFRPAPETPIAILARRRDREGRPFLAPAQVIAAERLREDFEIAQLEPRTAQDWSRALTGPGTGRPGSGPIPGATPSAARARVVAALQDLGPGLGDVALRCCCWQEGVETAEQQLGWSARSGKIVLRIALERLARHNEAQGDAGKLIG